MSSEFFTLAFTLSNRSSFIRPNSCPIGLKRISALSWRNNKRCSARDVNIRYGSSVPLVTKSSINTPIYDSDRFMISSCLSFNFWCAFIPAIKPCEAASSYPVVPLIWPAKYKLLINLVSNVRPNWVGGK